MSDAVVAGDDSFSLTVLTATYNRAHRLPALYASLLRQPDERVEWLIVDDGSTDGTAALVAEWAREGRMRVRYLSKENGGKHTALNMGIATIESRLTCIVDSDDYLTDDAVALIEAYFERYCRRSDLCGFAFTRVDGEGKGLLSGQLPAPEIVGTYVTIRVNGRLNGDMAEAWYTDLLRRYPFPEFPGERFLAEGIVWIRMGLDHAMVFIDRPIYVCEYLPGGLTRTGRALAVRSPRGAMARARLLMHPRCSIRVRTKGAVLFVAYGRLAGIGLHQLVKEGRHPALALVGLLPGILLAELWHRRYA